MHVARKLPLLSVVACVGLTLAAIPARAEYPERPIELIVPWGPGGGADQLARLVSKLAEPLLGPRSSC
jgi:tripartite-type tricarboxylate transporter receptor subunit TctC